MTKIEQRVGIIKKLIAKPGEECIEYDRRDFNYNGTMVFDSTNWRVAKVAQLLGSRVAESKTGIVMIKKLSSRRVCKNRMCINPNHMERLPEPIKMSHNAKEYLRIGINNVKSWQY